MINTMVDNEIDEPEPDMINFVTQDGIVGTAVKERVDFLYTKWANPIGPGFSWTTPSGRTLATPGVLMDHTKWANPNIPMAGRVGGPECSQGRPRVVVCGMCSEC